MHLNFPKKWPHNYGFEIYGNGPSYVITVEKGSMAHKAGLRQGDQLLEVNGHDVTNMPAGQIKALARRSAIKPPELEVTSCLKTHVIKPRHPMGYGFKVSNKRPVIVTSVDYGESAHKSGLRVGDIILEAKSRTATDVNALPAVLSQKRYALTLQCIPVARTSNMVEVDKTLSRVVAPDSRLFKAKDLHNKLEILLGNDYRRKMAVVAALKQYAEDRNMAFLCSALNDVLDTKSQRNVLAHIRLLIPPVQRPQFDELTGFNRSKVTPLSNYPAGPASTEIAHHMGQRKLFQVVREADSFGFVIKSSCPSIIETVDPGGAAEKAGLLPGDYIMKLNGIDVRETDHDRLVQLLRDSGSSPTLEVLRCTKVASSSNSVVSSSSSSLSSHNSVNNILYSSAIVDKDGNTFTEKAQFLLTPKEQNVLKRAIKSYIIKRDIIELHSSVSAILDAPSKKMLWTFLFVLLSTPHREYVSHHVNIPVDVLMDIVKSEEGIHSDITDAEKIPSLDQPDPEEFPPSFEQHTDFLLTNVEKLQFKKSLEQYKKNHEVSSLTRTLESILDTPSKQTLWRHVLPHLTTDDKDYIRKRLNLHDQKTASLSLTNMDSYIGSSNNIKEDVNNLEKATSAEDDILYGESQHQFQTNSESSSDESEDGVYSNNPTMNRKWMTSNSMLEHNSSVLMREETQKTAQHVQNSITVHERLRDTAVGDETKHKDPDYHENHLHVSIIPVASSDVKLKQSPFYNQELHSPQSSLREMEVSTGKYPEPSATRSTDFYHDIASDSSVSSSSDDSDGSIEARYDLTNFKYSRQTKKGASAFRDFNDGVSREMSDDDSSLGSINLNQWDRESDKDDEKDDGREKDIQKDDDKYFHSTPPLPPPPPPLPPPPPPPLLTVGLVTQESSDTMNVKRINWEKLDNKSVQNTIWEKMSDHDLGEVIQYLELETQFSTKSIHHKDSDRKHEILIMDKKKAYNISILLGHLKMSVADIKKTLYSMDETTLSPDLLGQLLSFVPNEHEVSQYRQYNGDISLLAKADQFAYQMSLVPDYEERLKALKFKASFKERVEELRKSLENVRSASQELRNSKKLAHILEVILAMGNSMNKGNSRVGEAAGFRITFLTQLDVTKTADKKSSFLHVLAEAACSKFPETAELADDLPTVQTAAKVSLETLTNDVQDLWKTLQEMSAGLERSQNNSQYSESGDQFQEVMSHFVVKATEEIQSLFRLQASAADEFSSTVEYFGENPTTLSTTDLFGIFLEFTRNFEKAHRHNLILKKQ